MCHKLQCRNQTHALSKDADLLRYTSAKRTLLSNTLLPISDGVPVHITASLIAGTVATTVCAPADVLKSRMQSATSARGKSPVGAIAASLQSADSETGAFENNHGFVEN